MALKAAPLRPLAKAARSGLSTRSYVWRGPHRGAVALRKVSVCFFGALFTVPPQPARS